MPEIVKIILVLLVVIYFSFIIDLIIKFWALFPIQEVKDTPLYITKNLSNELNGVKKVK